ncbi:Universal stress protein family protein [Grimontia celer]|uniref:Universal stress protein family protein n=1 Tax=Grimontia celer TaxID=1796497 RepID=A0A128F1I2_9GAMM|nr:universal stress protein [Grimontia celer]CZF80662.1 Universal stress protein family protein [Grimontia celer]
MTIKTIIMPFASHAYARERLEGALNVARYFGAHLDVLHAKINPRQLLPEESQLISDEFYKRIDQIVSDYVSEDFESVREAFDEACKSLGISQQAATPGQTQSTSFWHDVPGFRGEVVAERGKISDLTVVPQPKRGKTSVSFEAAILHSGKPVLVMPRTQTAFSPKSVVIAWNGDTQAVRAVAAAMPLLKRAEKVTIITSERSETKRPTQKGLRDYLALHGIDGECVVFKSGRMRVPQALLETANQHNADLIVCGAYAHQRIHQQMFGDVTKTLLRKSTLPLLMIG